MAPTEFKIDTSEIPADVDWGLAAQRNDIIERWRREDIDTETAFRGLLRHYWDNQANFVKEGTGVYLMASSYEFPVEADMDMDEVERIWSEELPE